MLQIHNWIDVVWMGLSRNAELRRIAGREKILQLKVRASVGWSFRLIFGHIYENKLEQNLR